MVRNIKNVAKLRNFTLVWEKTTKYYDKAFLLSETSVKKLLIVYHINGSTI